MNLREEIARTAWELYEKSGRVDGRDKENWLEAERIVKARMEEETSFPDTKNPANEPAEKKTIRTKNEKPVLAGKRKRL